MPLADRDRKSGATVPPKMRLSKGEAPPGSQSPHQYTGHEESISKLPSRMFSVTTSPVAAGVLTELQPGQNALGRSEGKAKSKSVLLT